MLVLELRIRIIVHDDQIHECRYWQADITIHLSAANMSSV